MSKQRWTLSKESFDLYSIWQCCVDIVAGVDGALARRGYRGVVIPRADAAGAGKACRRRSTQPERLGRL